MLKRTLLFICASCCTLLLLTFLSPIFNSPLPTASADDDDDENKHKRPKASKAVHAGDIRGTITRCGAPLSRVMICVAGHSFLAKTDSSGNFKLHYVQPGNYKLMIEDGSELLSTIDNVSVIKKRITDLGIYDFCLDSDNDGFDESQDCDDQNPNVFPGANEACDGIDNNCDGVVDEGCPTCSDDDLDGFFAQQGCNSAVDCDDQNAAINPGATELCDDNIDNNCNAEVDEGCLTCTPGDSCDTGSPGQCAAGAFDNACTCQQLSGPSDELCDSVDNDCDGQVDQDNPEGGASCSTGGLGVCSEGVLLCSDGSLSCQQLNQASPEVCDGVDNNCNGEVDENGVCCPAGTTFCGGVCADLNSDPNNCGSCGQACPLGQACNAGSCV